jgi:hypothetical protein
VLSNHPDKLVMKKSRNSKRRLQIAEYKRNAPAPVESQFDAFKAKYPEQVGPIFGKWEFTRTEQRIIWWETGGNETLHWRALAVFFLVVYGCFISILAVGVLIVLPLMVISLIIRGLPVTVGETDYGLLQDLLIMFAIMATTPWVAVFRKDVFRFEIDFETEKFILHESSFPNRRRVLIVPFSAIEFIEPCSLRLNGGAHLEIRYRQERGKHVKKKLGDNIPKALLNEHLDCCRPVLSGRILELAQYDD